MEKEMTHTNKNFRRVALNGIPLTIHKARVSAFPMNRVWEGDQRPLNQTEMTDFISFDLERKSELEIEIPEAKKRHIEIRPLKLDLKREVDENAVRLQVGTPGQFTVEVDGKHQVLHVFANPPFIRETDAEDLYFPPGEHDAGIIMPRSGQTVHIDAGAIVYGAIFLYRVNHVRIVGRGILDSSRIPRGNDRNSGPNPFVAKMRELGLTERDFTSVSSLVAYECKNLTVEGIIIRDSPFWSVIIRNACRNVLIDNIKIIGQWRYNSDGIDVCASEDIVIRNCFIRSFDDCIIARGAYLDGEDTAMRNMRVEQCVLWCDWGKTLEVWSGDKTAPIENIEFDSSSLIHLAAIALDVTTWYGCGNTRIRNIRFRNLAIDLSETIYAQQIQRTPGDAFLWKNDWQPRLAVINCDRLGKKLGNQRAGEAGDPEQYRLEYRDILMENIVFYGNGKPLPLYIETVSAQHLIRDITLRKVETGTIHVSGNIQNLQIEK